MKKMSLMKRRSMLGWVFCIPFLVGFIFFFLSPLIHSGYLSFHTIKASADGLSYKLVGWQHYYDLFFENADYIPALKQSFTDLLIDGPCILLFSFFIASVLSQKFHGRTLARAIFFLPVIIYSGALAMSSNQDSAVTMDAIAATASNSATGITQMTDVLVELVSTIKIDTSLLDFVTSAVDRVQTIAVSSGVQILIFLAGLQTISPSLYEASSMEGATGWENFWKITFPMISPMILVNAVYTIIDSVSGRNNPVINLIYAESSVYGHHGVGAAMSWVYVLLISTLLAVFFGLASKKVYYEDYLRSFLYPAKCQPSDSHFHNKRGRSLSSAKQAALKIPIKRLLPQSPNGQDCCLQTGAGYPAHRKYPQSSPNTCPFSSYAWKDKKPHCRTSREEETKQVPL